MSFMSSLFEVKERMKIKKLLENNGSSYVVAPKQELEKQEKTEYREITYEGTKNELIIRIRPHRTT